MRGVVFHVEQHGHAWVDDGRLVNRTGSIDVAGHLSAFVAHPSVHLDPWPTEADVGASPFPQRTRPSYGEGALEEILASSREIPNDTWRERCRVLGYTEVVETGGGTLGATRVLGPEMRFEIRQTGYGSGYGGARPVALVSAKVTGAAAARASFARAELVQDVRRLVGLDALPERRSPGDVDAPAVMDAAFWQRSGRAPS